MIKYHCIRSNKRQQSRICGKCLKGYRGPKEWVFTFARNRREVLARNHQ